MVEDIAQRAGSLAARWTRLASLGLLLAAAGSLILTAAILAFGVDTGGGPWLPLIFTVIPFMGALLVNGERTWAKIAGIVTGLLTALALFWTAFGLFQPASFFDFVPGLLILPGALIGLGASIAALVRRSSRTAAGEKPERTWIRTVLIVAAALIVISGVLTVTSRTTADLAEAGYAMRMRDFEFDRSSYEVSGGTTVYVRNDDPFFHTFTVDELDIDLGLSPGSATLITIPTRPGAYVLYCRPHARKDDPADEGMAARLIIS